MRLCAQWCGLDVQSESRAHLTLLLRLQSLDQPIALAYARLQRSAENTGSAPKEETMRCKPA